MSEAIIKAIDTEIHKHEAEITKLRQMKRIAKGSSVVSATTPEAIVEYLHKYPRSTTNNIASGLGVSYDQAHDAINVAQRKKLIENATPGQKRYVKWIIKEKETPKPKQSKPKSSRSTSEARVTKERKTRQAKGKRGRPPVAVTRKNRENVFDLLMQEHEWVKSSYVANRLDFKSATAHNYLEYLHTNGRIQKKSIQEYDKGAATNYYAANDVPLLADGRQPISDPSRETKIHPGEGIEEGRKRTEPIMGSIREVPDQRRM